MCCKFAYADAMQEGMEDISRFSMNETCNLAAIVCVKVILLMKFQTKLPKVGQHSKRIFLTFEKSRLWNVPVEQM